jgi:hypothetical protein
LVTVYICTMNADSINEHFIKMIATRGIHNTIGVSSGHVRLLRYKLANNIGISTDLKLQLLQKSGWRQDDKVFTQKDLVAAVSFAIRSSASAKAHGAEYIVEKFLAKK